MLALKGEKVLFTPPKGMPSAAKEAVLAHVRARRDEIFAYLVAEASPAKEGVAGFLAACGVPTCAGCYTLEHNLHIHPPKGRTL